MYKVDHATRIRPRSYQMCEDAQRGLCLQRTNRIALYTSPRSAQLRNGSADILAQHISIAHLQWKLSLRQTRDHVEPDCKSHRKRRTSDKILSSFITMVVRQSRLNARQVVLRQSYSVLVFRLNRVSNASRRLQCVSCLTILSQG